MLPEPLINDDMVGAIIETYARATDAQRAEGRAWYGVAGDLAVAIAEASGTAPERVAYAIAALSPRNPWRWNIADAYSFAVARRAGLTMPKATTFKRNQLAAWQALAADGTPWTSAAPKVTAFVAAILGDHDAVVVDVWAYRVATGRTPKNAVRDIEYRVIARAYAEAARIVGEAPAHIQAITWLVAQTEGLASIRSGRHDKTFKRGTDPVIVSMMSGQLAMALG